MPAVGEVDAFLKMPKPDGQKEDLGINQLDEPALNAEDKTVLEHEYSKYKSILESYVKGKKQGDEPEEPLLEEKKEPMVE